MDIRVVDFDGEPWFVAKDVLVALGYPRGSQGYQLRHLGNDEKDALKIKATVRPLICISESGLYRLIMRSDKPQARAFQDWVTKVVLPSDLLRLSHQRADRTGSPHPP